MFFAKSGSYLRPVPCAKPAASYTHIVLDSMGLLLAVLVTAADVDDAKAAADLFARLDGQPMGKVVRMYADSKYHNFDLYEWVEENARWDLFIHPFQGCFVCGTTRLHQGSCA